MNACDDCRSNGPRALCDCSGGLCRQCGDPCRVGYVTCGTSECQEAEYRDNQIRAKARGRRVSR